jgi:hypothetical protein
MCTSEPVLSAADLWLSTGDPWFVLRDVIDEDLLDAAIRDVESQKASIQLPTEWTAQDEPVCQLEMTPKIQRLCTYAEEVSSSIYCHVPRPDQCSELVVLKTLDCSTIRSS